MRRIVKLFICIMLVACSGGQNTLPDKASPFTAVEWEGDLPKIRLNNEWYFFEALDSLSKDLILSYCKEEYGQKWKKRFAEDLVEVLEGMDYEPAIEVNLSLRKNNQIRSITAVFTEENRAKVKLHNDKLKLKDPAQREKLKNRFRSFATNAKFREKILSEAKASGDSTLVKMYETLFEEINNSLNKTMNQGQVSADLEFLLDQIDHKYAYADLKKFEYKKEIQALQQRIQAPISRKMFAVEVQKYLARFGDGHTRVKGISGMLAQGYLPFVVAPFENRVLCIDKNGTKLLDKEYPYLSAINGITTKALLEKSGELVADGSAQFKEYQTVARLTFIQYLLDEYDSLHEDVLEVLLENELGEIKTIQMKISAERIRIERFPNEDFITETNIAYLRIPFMRSSAEYLDGLKAKMEEFRNTDGLIIDIRNNPGGSRAIARLLAPYFIPKGHSPIIVNTAVYRTNERITPEEGFLTNRFLYPMESSEFTEQSRESIRKFLTDFKPEWNYAKDKFSEMHFFLLSSNEDVFYYEKPVVVLINSNCFSASDIFAAAFKELPNITLVGEATGGGSGRSIGYTLPNSEIEVKLSSMVSFQPSGLLFEGNGVSPDIEVRESLSDVLGKTDSILERAKKVILDKNTME